MLSKVTAENAVFGVTLGVTACLLYMLVFYSGQPFGFYKVAPYYFEDSKWFEINPSGFAGVLLLVFNAALMAAIFIRKMYVGLLIALGIFLLGLVVIPTGHPNREKMSNAETKQNVHLVKTKIDEYHSAHGNIPVDVYSVLGAGEFAEMPLNSWGHFKIYSRFYMDNTSKIFAADSRSLTGSASSRFGERGSLIGNLSTGYDIGRELVPWWDAFGEGEKPSKEHAVVRGILAGNFVYLLCDEDGVPIPFSKVDEKPAEHYFLAVFGSPLYKGMDVWTPTGDPDMPVRLEQDGIMDGVILVLTDEDMER